MAKNQKGYNFKKREPYWQKFWETNGVYEFDPEDSGEVYSIDTPPPTVSGDLHMGHVFSYSQAEVIARFKRMQGKNVRYPLGLDNNGLPTERLVEKEIGKKGKDMKTEDFIKKCLKITEEYNEKYVDLWKKLGMSYDWRLKYSTISEEVREISQQAFKELYKDGLIYKKNAPALFCTECNTSFAQAEKEDEEKEAYFYDLIFKDEQGEDLIISTTRPELLPACVAVFVHPEDTKYNNLVGEEVETPLGTKVKVMEDEKVDMEKGSGAVMCCTYGDDTDVYWKKVYDLDEKIILDYEGRFTGVKEVPEMNQKSVEEGREIIVNKLKEEGFIHSKEHIVHNVDVHERCGRPVEFLPTEQWFVEMLEMKEELLEKGEELNWYPDYMKTRYDQWVEGLKWDWCISRERFYGIPIPIFKCDNCDFAKVPEKDELPIDPREEESRGSCPQCDDGKLVPETKVLDTWFTSSLTPDINNQNDFNGSLKGKIHPMSMRPQAHEIIRTWTVYTVLMSLYRHGQLPWEDVMISGHLLLKSGDKISKSKGGGENDPEELIEKESADAVRYAMYGVKLGKDGYFEKKEIDNGQKLITKLYNAGKLVLNRLQDYTPGEDIEIDELEHFDRWILQRASNTAKEMEDYFEDYDFAKARKVFEDFFWGDFCDNYLEIVKDRLYLDSESEEEKKGNKSAKYSVYKVYLAILKMTAPFMPHIVEEIYHAEIDGWDMSSTKEGGYFFNREGDLSIHTTDWPVSDTDFADDKIVAGADSALTVISKVRKSKTKAGEGLNTDTSLITITCSQEKEEVLKLFLDDIFSVTNAKEIEFETGDEFKVDVEL